MRVHTTAVNASKHFPQRIHVKFTDDNNVPDNVRDRTFHMPNELESDHNLAVYQFLLFHKMGDRQVKFVGPTLINRGYVYQILEA